MQIFLDTANIKEIREIEQLGLLDGVTTNPTLISKENKPAQDILKEICSVVKGPVSAEVIGQTTKEMVKEAQVLAKIADNIVIKIPMTQEGINAVRQLVPAGIKTNVTLCFNMLQSLISAKADSTYVSVFVGRLDDGGHNGMEVIRQVKESFSNYNLKTQLIVASIRHPLHVVESAMIGADIVTIPYKVIMQLFKHPLTDLGIIKFLEDWKKIPK